MIPWFMLDLDNLTFYTSVPIPTSDIEDDKKISLTEVPVPGLGYEPVSHGGFGNRHITFTIPIIDRSPVIGNSARLKFFEQLRNPITPFLNPFASTDFVRGPRVLYQWGTGSIPLIYKVNKVKFRHKQTMINDYGNPQYTDVSIDLILDEEEFLFLGEELFRKVGAVIGSVQSLIDVTGSGKPF